MNPHKSLPPQCRGALHRPIVAGGAIQSKVAKTKTGGERGGINLSRPAAPPAYRPQPVPRVLQRKMAGGQQTRAGQPPRLPIAPPVYRPEAKRVAQPQLAATIQARKQPQAPPVYRPQPTPRVLQTKPSRTGAIIPQQGNRTPAPGQQLLKHNSSNGSKQRTGLPEVAAKGPVARLQAARPGIVQRTSINPNAFFGATRDINAVDADINANELTGFGTTVNAVTWHTKLVFDAVTTPGAVGVNAMNAEGSGVTGVIGPDHPYGSQPWSATALQNNQIAQIIRGGTPHVAAHIVNDQLGGPGVTQNLFAFPATANTLMETQVEGKMKDAVVAGNYIYYRAVVHHPAQGPADYITMSWNKLDENGNDIGGGQANVRINANNTAANTLSLADAGGTEAKNVNLINPTNATVICRTPWGPFQMPDPKNIVALREFLDISEFPAVGNKRAFIEFLKINKGVSNRLQMMLVMLGNNTKPSLKAIGSWIQDTRVSRIAIKERRGVTKKMLDGLLNGTTQEKENAFIEIMGTGDAEKVIPAAAAEFASVARENARILI